MRTDPNKIRLAIQPTVNGILSSGCLTRKEHLYLTSILLADQRMSDEDRLQINRVLEYVQVGRLTLVD